MSDDENIAYYLTRLDSPSKTLYRIFDRVDFYSVHYDNAVSIASDFLRTPEAIKYIGKSKIPSVAISKQNYESLLRDLLLIKQYRVELHAKSSGSWKRVAKASPGNLVQFEESLFLNHEINESGGVACLHFVMKDNRYDVSVVFIDVMMKQLSFCEVSDTEMFTLLESILVQLSPKECLLSVRENSTEYKKVNKILQQLSVFSISPKSSDFLDGNGKKYVSRLAVQEDGICALLTASDSSMKALSALVKYLDVMSDETNFNQFEVTQIPFQNSMRLDSAAFSGLNVFPRTGCDAKFSSLFGILNNCCTPQGQRLLGSWLKQPLLNLSEISERMNIVESFVDDSQLQQDLCNGLKRFPDFYRIAKKVQRGKGKLQDCYRLYSAVLQLPTIIDILGNHSGIHETSLNCKFITPFREFEEDFKMYIEMVETTVDIGKCDQGEFIIRPSFDENLADLRAQLETLQEEIDDEFNKICRVLKAEKGKGVKCDSNSTYGHYCRVPRKDEKGVRNSRNFEILQTKKEGVLFTTSNLRSLSDNYNAIRKNYDEVQSSIVDEILKVASGYAEPMIQLNHIIAYMDCLLSFAMASVNAPTPYVRPKVLEKGSRIISLTGSRHPCVELNDDITFIGNDVNMDQSDAKFLVITGPNMGGKSTYIRQIGCIALLAQIGCFVPCESATISIFSSIYSRVGASDSQARGISTFMAEMLETSAILQSADADSLIIIDELGRGTSTYDGFGLAWAISNHIIKNVNCLTVFATHFHEMTNLEQIHSCVKNYHVTALVEENNLTLLYRVEPGPCDQSFGVHVAKLADFPPHVITLAKKKAVELDKFQFVPEECLDEQPAYAEAAEVIDKLLGEVKASYISGVRNKGLKDVVENFINSNADVLTSNTILSNFVNNF